MQEKQLELCKSLEDKCKYLGKPSSVLCLPSMVVVGKFLNGSSTTSAVARMEHVDLRAEMP